MPTSEVPGDLSGDPGAALGVQLPMLGGSRSSSAFGRRVVSAALAIDPPAAARAAAEQDWRSGYLPHFRVLVEAGLASPQDAIRVATDGLAAVQGSMVLCRDGSETPLAAVSSQPATTFGTGTLTGYGEPEGELSLPLHGERLRGDALRRQLAAWVRQGVLEQSCAAAVTTVLEHPEWLRLDGRRVVLLGAGAEMGPLQALLRWGADVVAVDLPRPDLWTRVLATAAAAAGTLTFPTRVGSGPGGTAGTPEGAGADLLVDLPDIAAWLDALPGRLVLGNYVYADGVTNLRVAAAVDALTTWLLARRPDTELAFLATPTDVFAVPQDAVDAAHRGFDRPGPLRTVRRPLRAVSGGRLLRRQYDTEVLLAGEPAGLHDSLVPQQGPNYALAKRLQRWRASVAAAAGTTVSLNIAPPTRTRSVLKNRLLAAAYAGCRRFGVEVFEPATSNVLMAALLVHDLHTGPPTGLHPYEVETLEAAHGGLWRQPYEIRSVLGLAVLVGIGGMRG